MTFRPLQLVADRRQGLPHAVCQLLFRQARAQIFEVGALDLTAPDGDVVGKQEQVPLVDPVVTEMAAFTSVRLAGRGAGAREPAGPTAGDLDADFHILEAAPRPQQFQRIESCLLPECLTQDLDRRLSTQIAQQLPVLVVCRDIPRRTRRERLPAPRPPRAPLRSRFSASAAGLIRWIDGHAALGASQHNNRDVEIRAE